MNCREILSLQFGHYANFVGTHWWNIQEAGFSYQPEDPSEINHDILFREGLTFKGNVTYTPRLLLADLTGSLKGAEYSNVYIPDEADSPEAFEDWPSDIVKVDESGVEKNIVSQEKGDCSQVTAVTKDISEENYAWCDFLHTRLHPRSVNIVNEYQHQDEKGLFDVHPTGWNLWKTTQFEEDFCDKIRNYIEECSSFQGFHILLDAINGFGGLSSSCIQYLSDEYDSKSIFAFPLIPTPYVKNNLLRGNQYRSDVAVKKYTRLLNIALCFESLGEHSSAFTPLSTGSKVFKKDGARRLFHHVEYDQHSQYHSSAILASALDTFTSKYRLKGTDCSLRDLCSDLSSYGRKACATSVCLPFSINRGNTLIDTLDNWDGPLSRSITPNCEIDVDKVTQIFTLRGVPESRLKLSQDKAGKQRDMPAYKCNTIKEMLNYYVECSSYGSTTDITSIKRAVPVNKFPRIFDSYVDSCGNIDTYLKGAVDVESVPVLAGLHNGQFVGTMLKELIEDVQGINFRSFHQFHNEGVDSDELEECLNNLMSLQERYEESDAML